VAENDLPTPEDSSESLVQSDDLLESVPDAATETPAESPEEIPAETPARRPRTARLLIAAVLLGPLLGGGIGYAIQDAQPATPLPALHMPTLAYPATPLDAKTAAEIAPKPLGIDGDLRKLLIAKPDGADDWDDFGGRTGWLSIGEKADTLGNSGTYFTKLASTGFRRDAVVFWKKGDVKYSVELIQYDAAHADSAQIEANSQGNRFAAQAIPGTVTGWVDAPDQQDHYADSTEQFYKGLAVARRGDVVMEITVFSPNKVNADELMDLARRQWERLA
jgi:hypothetical protein